MTASLANSIFVRLSVVLQEYCWLPFSEQAAGKDVSALDVVKYYAVNFVLLVLTQKNNMTTTIIV